MANKKSINPGIIWPFRINNDFIEQYSQRRNQWETPIGTKDNLGYLGASWKAPEGRKFLRLHSIVWRTFYGPVPDGLEIDHIDMDKTNNRITNLRLLTHHENILQARQQLGNWSVGKLTPGQLELVLSLPSDWHCLKALAQRWSVSKFTLANIRALAKRTGDSRYLACL